VLPGLDQVNGEVIALTLPVHLALAWSVRRLAERAGGTEVRAQARPVPARAAA